MKIISLILLTLLSTPKSSLQRTINQVLNQESEFEDKLEILPESSSTVLTTDDNGSSTQDSSEIITTTPITIKSKRCSRHEIVGIPQNSILSLTRRDIRGDRLKQQCDRCKSLTVCKLNPNFCPRCKKICDQAETLSSENSDMKTGETQNNIVAARFGTDSKDQYYAVGSVGPGPVFNLLRKVLNIDDNNVKNIDQLIFVARLSNDEPVNLSNPNIVEAAKSFVVAPDRNEGGSVRQDLIDRLNSEIDDAVEKEKKTLNVAKLSKEELQQIVSRILSNNGFDDPPVGVTEEPITSEPESETRCAITDDEDEDENAKPVVNVMSRTKPSPPPIETQPNKAANPPLIEDKPNVLEASQNLNDLLAADDEQNSKDDDVVAAQEEENNPSKNNLQSDNQMRNKLFDSSEETGGSSSNSVSDSGSEEQVASEPQLLSQSQQPQDLENNIYKIVTDSFKIAEQSNDNLNKLEKNLLENPNVGEAPNDAASVENLENSSNPKLEAPQESDNNENERLEMPNSREITEIPPENLENRARFSNSVEEFHNMGSLVPNSDANEGDPRVKNLYFIGDDIKLPLKMYQKTNGEMQLKVDIEKLCHCQEQNCTRKHPDRLITNEDNALNDDATSIAKLPLSNFDNGNMRDGLIDLLHLQNENMYKFKRSIDEPKIMDEENLKMDGIKHKLEILIEDLEKIQVDNDEIYNLLATIKTETQVEEFINLVHKILEKYE